MLAYLLNIFLLHYLQLFFDEYYQINYLRQIKEIKSWRFHVKSPNPPQLLALVEILLNQCIRKNSENFMVLSSAVQKL